MRGICFFLLHLGYSLSLLDQIYHIQEVGLTYQECLDVIFISCQITCQIRVRWQQSKFETYMRCLMVMSLSVPIATHCMCCSDVINLKGGSLEHNNNSSHFCSVVSHWQGWARGSLLRPLLLDFKFDLKLKEWFRCQLIEILFPHRVCRHEERSPTPSAKSLQASTGLWRNGWLTLQTPPLWELTLLFSINPPRRTSADGTCMTTSTWQRKATRNFASPSWRRFSRCFRILWRWRARRWRRPPWLGSWLPISRDGGGVS